jgi:hypothetical protein
VAPHPVVHGRNDEHRTARSQQHCAEQIICAPVRGTRKKVGGGGSNDDDVRFARKTDVRKCLSRFKKIGMNPSPSHALERNGAHKLLSAARHHHIDFGTFLRQKARQRYRLVAGDPSGDAQYDAPSPDVAQSYS